MPTVPRYPSQQQVQIQGIPNARVNTDAPLETFGGGDSLERFATATRGTLGTVAEIAKDERNKADQVAHLSAVTKLSELQTQLQVEASQLQGRDAFGAHEVVSEKFRKGADEIKNGLNNDDQRFAFDRAAASSWESLNKHVETHVAEQRKTFDNSETQGFVEASRKAAVLNANDPEAVQLELGRQKAALLDWGTRNGLKEDDAQFQQKLDGVLSSTHKVVVGSLIDSGNTKGALAYFNANKDNHMTPEDINAIQERVDHANTIQQGMDMWGKVKSMKFADGTPNTEKMESFIMSQKELPLEKKLKIYEFVKAQAADDNQQMLRRDQARERDFMNQLVQMRQNGTTLSEALQLAPKYAKDSYQQTLLTENIKSVYGPPKTSEVATYMNLWERVQDGKVNRQDLDSAFVNNKLSQSDYESLRKDFYKGALEGTSPMDKIQNERIKALAEEKFGSNKLDKENFLYTVHSLGRNRSPEERWKIANDQLKDAPGTGRIWDDPKWKVDLKQMDANNMAWGQAHEEVGQDQVNALKAGAAYKGVKDFSPGDIKGLADQFGGMQNIRVGTPVNNAIKSLTKYGKPATPANVRAVLEKYKDGNF